MAKIFISYRREDNPVLAAQIRDAFAAHFGQSNLWMDTEFALPRMNFGEVLSEALFDCDVFIAILGEHWLDVLHSKAAQHDSDFVRVEIAAALKHKIPVIPVRVGREGQLLQMWRPSELPDDIRAMLNFQTTDVTRENFKDDIVALVNAVEAARRGLPLEPGEIVRPSADIERMPSASALPSDPLAYHSIDTLQRLRRAAAGAIVQTEQVGDRALSEQRLPYAEIAALREQLAEKERETARYRGVTEELAKDLHQARIAREEFERLRDENKHQFEQQREALRSERMELRREVEMQVTGRTAMSRMRHKRIGAVVVLVAASGIAYLFRDRLSDVSRMLIDSIGRLLSDFGVSKGAILPLSAVAITSPTPPDVVDCSVFAPPVVRSDSQFMIQVFLHLVEQSERVEFLATSMDGSAKFRGRQTLQVSVPRDTLLRVVLDGQGIDVLEPVHEFVWRGEPIVAAFSCRLGTGVASDVLHPVARLYVEDKPVGRILFQVNVEESPHSRAPLQMPELTGVNARKYKFAFLSYASEDREEVLKRAQALEAVKISFFQDVLSLSPGERYERKIYRKIDEADLFMLFWSRSARDSKWVNNEIEYARACQRMNPEALPDIVPIVLDDPRDAPPPKLLSDQHFNGMIATLISYEGQRRKPGSGFLSRWFGSST